MINITALLVHFQIKSGFVETYRINVQQRAAISCLQGTKQLKRDSVLVFNFCGANWHKQRS